jgi:hypothetical protein
MNLMLTKVEIKKAVEQTTIIEKKYPEFYKLFKMIVELQNELNITKQISDSLKKE